MLYRIRKAALTALSAACVNAIAASPELTKDIEDLAAYVSEDEKSRLPEPVQIYGQVGEPTAILTPHLCLKLGSSFEYLRTRKWKTELPFEIRQKYLARQYAVIKSWQNVVETIAPSADEVIELRTRLHLDVRTARDTISPGDVVTFGVDLIPIPMGRIAARPVLRKLTVLAKKKVKNALNSQLPDVENQLLQASTFLDSGGLLYRSVATIMLPGGRMYVRVQYGFGFVNGGVAMSTCYHAAMF